MAHRHISTPIPWRGAELSQYTGWHHALTAHELDELDAAVEANADTPPNAISPANFPLDRLAERLGQIREELLKGSGVAKLTGFPVSHWTMPALQRAYIGLSSFLGTPTPQNRGEGLLREIRDRSDEGGTRVDSADALNWHNDRTDIVGLLSLSEAQRGGISRIASAIAIHNHLAAVNPAQLDTLLADYARFAPGDEVGGSSGIYRAPVFRYEGTTLLTHYSRTYITQAAAHAHGHPLSAAQASALEALVDAADELSFEMPLRAGEIQYLNNYAILHSRSAFTDSEHQHRLLWRVWLSLRDGETWTG